MNLEDEFIVAPVQSAHRHLPEGGAVSTGFAQPEAPRRLEAEA